MLKGLLNWLLITILLGAVLFIPALVAAFGYVKLHREPGWGQRPEMFPIAVMSNHRVHVVYKGDLAKFIAHMPDYTFTIPASERDAVRQQIDDLRAEEAGGNGKFESIWLAIRDRPDGSQRIHFIASQYNDTDNESWYIAHPKSIEPQYHRFALDLGVGMAAAFSTPAILAITAPLLSLAILVRRRFRKPSTPMRAAIRRALIAAAGAIAILAIMYADSDETLAHDTREIGALLMILLGGAAALWWPGLRRIARIATAATAIGIAAVLLGGNIATLIGFTVTCAILIASAAAADKVYEMCVTLGIRPDKRITAQF